MKKIALIFFGLLFTAAICPAQTKPAPSPAKEWGRPKVSDTPLPCFLTLAESPTLFGLKLNMPVPDARKIFPRALISDTIKDGPLAQFSPTFFRVPASRSLKNISGVPVQGLEFFGLAKGRIETLAVRFADRQALTPAQLFERVTALTRIAPEMWLMVDHGNGAHISWRTECNGFQAQFDAQKGFYYRLWLTRNAEVKPSDKPSIGDGD